MNYSSRYTCPSNIAIIKYWGKYGNQLPRNSSISFTLTNALSDTNIIITPSDKRSIEFIFEGSPKESFLPKIESFFSRIEKYFDFLNAAHFKIESSNSFPHSSGIASSASGMAALAMCLCDIETQMKGGIIDLQKASFLSRLGSGSACRSIYPKMAMWGQHINYDGSSNEYAIEVNDVHEVFKSFHDDILIVSSNEKSVSSTDGHALMDTNIFANQRYVQANDNMWRIKSILKAGDVEAFGILAESEAMTLHALMMCSDPSYILIEPDTINVINKIRQFRKETGLPIYFTLDAGPNVHILYPAEAANQISEFVRNELLKFSPQSLIIQDKVGNGPKKIY
jgi:diphosphomevalonate decarboxylase